MENLVLAEMGAYSRFGVGNSVALAFLGPNDNHNLRSQTQKSIMMILLSIVLPPSSYRKKIQGCIVL